MRRWWKRANEHLALKITVAVSTMTCFYIFLCWSMLPVFAPQMQNLVFYISGGILQLVFLPLIMVGQSVQSRTTEKRAIQDHTAVMEIVTHIRGIVQAMHAEIDDIKTIKQQMLTLDCVTLKVSQPEKPPNETPLQIIAAARRIKDGRVFTLDPPFRQHDILKLMRYQKVDEEDIHNKAF